MNQTEAEDLLAALKKLGNELKDRRVVPSQSTFLGDSDKTYIWTLKKAVLDIWNEAEKIVGPEMRGSKLLTSVLTKARAICDGKEKPLDYDNAAVFKTENDLPTEVRTCVNEANGLLQRCSSLKRELDETKDRLNHEQSRFRQQRHDEKKLEQFFDVTLRKAKSLHQTVMEQEFIESDAIKANLETKCAKCLEAEQTKPQKSDATVSTDLVVLPKTPIHASTQTISDEETNKTTDTSNFRKSDEELRQWLYQISRKCGIEDKDLAKTSLIDLAEKISEKISIIFHRHTPETNTIKSKLIDILQNCHFHHDVAKLKDDSVEKICECLKTATVQLQEKLERTELEATANAKKYCFVQNEREDLLNRLSQYTSAQLTHDNANVADLSDENRPTKLAERFSELYDNQWTDAFAELNGTYCYSEKKAISTLLIVLTQAYEFCLDYFEKQEQTILDALAGKLNATSATTSTSSTDPVKGSIENVRERKIISDLRKNAAGTSSNVVKTEFLKQCKRMDILDTDETSLRSYAMGCAQLCWYMVLQSPQIYIESNFKQEECFNTNKYKYYKTQGSQYKYIVWPVMYLRKDGSILSKGVAEAG